MDSGDQEQRAIERRRDEAARIIADIQKRKQLKQTNEWLLDQDALRRAAIMAGLEKPDEA
jgi:hypothetical protein